MIELDIWAILWPVFKQIWGFMGLDQKAISVGVFLLAWVVSGKILNLLRPEYKKGAVLSEVVHILWGATTFLLPFVILGLWLSGEYPLLAEAISFVASKFSWQERLNSWWEIFLLAVFVVAIQRFLIHRISLWVQRVVNEIPLVGSLIVVIVLVLEGMLFFASGLSLPIVMIAVAKDRGVLVPLAQDVPTIQPEGVALTRGVWEAIEEGVGRAQANGVSCNPYLILALKEYETGRNLCDASQEGSRSCVSSAGCLGMMQLNPETCQRNADRRGVTCDVWDPATSVEVACYAMADEMNINLGQTEATFINEFSSEGFVWNADPSGAKWVFNRAHKLQEIAMASMPEVVQQDGSSGDAPQSTTSLTRVPGYLWPGPTGSYVSYEWGASMSYGTHNGIDIILSGIPQFRVVAIADGRAKYWNGGACNAGIISLVIPGQDNFLYVHMSLDPEEIKIPTDGSWVEVQQGQVLGKIHNGTTTCSDGPHLHLMRSDGTYIEASEFER